MLGHRALNEGPLSSLLDTSDLPPILTTTETLRFATRSFTTAPSDSPANSFIDGRIALPSGLILSRKIAEGPDRQFGSTLDVDYGQLRLNNSDGKLDAIFDRYAIDGREIRLKIGSTQIDAVGREEPQAVSRFQTVYTSLTGSAIFQRDVIILNVRSLSSRLQDRLQSQTYLGTGGPEGSADIAGLTKPTAFGRCLNVPAQIVDPSILIYQLHAGTMNSVTAVYDRGIAIPFHSDFDTYIDLAAATLPPQTYATCLAAGCIRLSIAPLGVVTADIRGDNNGGYVDEHANIILKILRNYAGLSLNQIDTASFSILAGLQPNSMGLFIPSGDTPTIEEVIAQIALSCGAVAGQDRSGRYRVFLLDQPSSTPDWEFDDRTLVDIRPIPLPFDVPWKSWGVAYQRNWTRQTSTDLATGVGPGRRAFLESEDRFVYAQSADIAQWHVTSGGTTRMSLFAAKEFAEEEANRLIAFYGRGRSYYEITVKTALFSVEIGQTIRITYNRWNLHSGRNFIVTAIQDDLNTARSVITIYGGGPVTTSDYSIGEAITARNNLDNAYFSALPPALVNTAAITTAPTRPSQRGWRSISYPPIPSSLVGQQARNVLIPPTFPLDSQNEAPGYIPWEDPNPSTNQPAAFVGTAPDGSVSLEIRYTLGQNTQFVDAYILLIGPQFLVGTSSDGARHVGASFELWTEASFDWGAFQTGGKVGGGLWGGRRPASGNVSPAEQGGISIRNVWGVGSGSPAAVNMRGYAYLLNRSVTTDQGIKTVSLPNRWTTGGWQTVEYEGKINTPGKADGFGRMWLGTECVAEFTNAIWAISNEFWWRGVLISDSWQDGSVPKNQKRWIRNIKFYFP